MSLCYKRRVHRIIIALLNRHLLFDVDVRACLSVPAGASGAVGDPGSADAGGAAAGDGAAAGATLEPAQLFPNGYHLPRCSPFQVLLAAGISGTVFAAAVGFSIFHFPFSMFHFPFSIFHFPFSIFHFPFSEKRDAL
jgi:hypothetical protein